MGETGYRPYVDDKERGYDDNRTYSYAARNTPLQPAARIRRGYSHDSECGPARPELEERAALVFYRRARPRGAAAPGGFGYVRGPFARGSLCHRARLFADRRVRL